MLEEERNEEGFEVDDVNEERHEQREERPLPEHHEHKVDFHHMEEKKAPKKKKVDYWKIATVALAILVAVSIITNGFNFLGTSSEDAVAEKVLAFVNNNLLTGGAVAELGSISEENGLYNVKMEVSGQEVDTYVTKDGELFFPQALRTDEVIPQQPAAQQQPPTPDIVKSDKPIVELFIMSHCPYGTQAEKGLLPVAELLGDKIDFTIRFVSYAMHGEKEVMEQLNQYCIQEEQLDKFGKYLVCFLEDGDSERCLEEAEIDMAKLESCTARVDEEYKVTALLNDQGTWSSGRFPQFNVDQELNDKYGIRGSPGLVINGQMVDSGRSPSEYLATVCAAFNEPPEECGQSLRTEGFPAGFGYSGEGAATGSCG